MRPTLFLPLALLVCAALPARAQAPQAGGPTLTLEEALSLASRSNPDLVQTRNARRSAGAALRSAYGELLPSADASFQSQFRQGGTQPINGVTFETSDIRQSNYWLGVQYRIGPGTLLSPRVQKANLDAADADVGAMDARIRSDVAQQYLTALQAAATADLQDTLVIVAEQQLELARARAAVGAGTQLDVSKAEVGLGQQRVQALQRRNTAEIEKLRLFTLMGVPQPDNVRLTSEFPVVEPSIDLDSLMDLAERRNPGLNALRSRSRAAGLQVKQARAQYLPTLSLSTGWGGYTYEYTNPDFLVQQARFGTQQNFQQCSDMNVIRATSGLSQFTCGAPDLSPDEVARIRSDNDQFPFGFEKSPWSFTATVSLPIFDNFQREQRVQEAQVGRSNAEARERARALTLRQEITSAYRTLVTAARSVTLQEQNARTAREELRLAQERYRVGAATFLDVTTARGSVERAETDRINAIYDYHRAQAALEAAVGRPLR
jgi:outer membrane protein